MHQIVRCLFFTSQAKTLGDIADRCIEAAVAKGLIAEDDALKKFLRDVIVKRHRHQYEGNHPLRTKGHQESCMPFCVIGPSVFKTLSLVVQVKSGETTPSS